MSPAGGGSCDCAPLQLLPLVQFPFRYAQDDKD